jgi:hypothetical protein
MTAPRPTIPDQIAVLNTASEMIAGNTASIRVHGWRADEIDAVQIGLGRVRATLEWLERNAAPIRAALAKPINEDGA